MTQSILTSYAGWSPAPPRQVIPLKGTASATPKTLSIGLFAATPKAQFMFDAPSHQAVDAVSSEFTTSKKANITFVL